MEFLLTKIGSFLVSIGLVVSSWAGIVSPAEVQLGAYNFVGGQKYYLAGSGVGTSDTSITLTSFTQPVSGIELTMSDFGEIGYATLEPNTSKKEFISFTGITQDSNSTQATLTGVTRGLGFVSPYTASSTLRQTHSGGTVLVISNPPQLYNELATKKNSQTITGVWTFASTAPPVYDAAFSVSSSSLQFAPASFVAGFANVASTSARNQILNGANTFTGLQTFNTLPQSSATPSSASDLTTKTYVDGLIVAGGTPASTSTAGTVIRIYGTDTWSGSCTVTGGTGGTRGVKTGSSGTDGVNGSNGADGICIHIDATDLIR